MPRVEHLRASYRAVGLPGHRALLLHHADALRFLDDCERLGLTVLGMDFFKVQGPFIVNTQIADFTRGGENPNAPGHSVDKARDLIRDGFPSETDVVEFVVVE